MSGVRRAAQWDARTADAVRRVVDEATAADGHAPVDEAVELALAHDGLARAALWLAGEDAFALVRHRPEGEATVDLDLVTRPPARGRGLGAALVAAALQSGPGPWAAWSHGDHPAARRLAQRHGFAATRSLWVMRLPGEVDVPPAPVPDGVRLRGFAPADADGVLAVNAAAFADHPEQGSLDRAGFEQRVSQEWFDPEGLVVAERDGEVVGFHWTKAHPASSGQPAHGEVYVIGVAPGMQGSGLGAALLHAGIDHLRRRGPGAVALYVESDNPAVRLYQRIGFTHADEDTHVQYTRG